MLSYFRGQFWQKFFQKPMSLSLITIKATFHLTISMRGQRATGKIQRNNYHHGSCGPFLTGKTMPVFLIFMQGSHRNVKIVEWEVALRLQLHGAIYRPYSFVLMPRYCANLKAMRYESTSLNRIVADKSHRVISIHCHNVLAELVILPSRARFLFSPHFLTDFEYIL